MSPADGRLLQALGFLMRSDFTRKELPFDEQRKHARHHLVQYWRAVLTTGRLREPVSLPRLAPRRSPTQIAVGWGGRSADRF
jgi:hypothetical protein